MNILYIVGENLYPANSGGRKAILQRLEYMSKNHNVYLFAFYNSNDEKLMQLECCKYSYYYKRNKKNSLLKWLSLPFCVASRSGNKINKFVEDICNKHQIDTIVYEQSYLANIYIKKDSIRRIIDSHNVEFESMRTMCKTTNNPLKKIVFYIDSKKLYKFEKKIYTSSLIDGYTFISERDMQSYQLKFNLDKSKIFYAKYGCIKHNNNKNFGDKHSFLFVGSLNYKPNQYGAEWLIDKVMPIVIERDNKIKLYIVGKEPSKKIGAAASDRIIVTGMVDSVDEYYNKCQTVLIPIFHGGGVKIKLIEAASFEKLILSTKFGIEGSEFGAEDVLVANSEQEFADMMLKISEGIDFSFQIKKTFDVFEKNYDLDIIFSNYDSFIQNVK